MENNKNIENKQSFLDKIRSLDHKTKKQLLIILSTISIFLVIYIWGIYFNFITLNFAEEQINNQNIKMQIGLIDKLKISGAFVSEIILNLVNYFKNLVNSSKEYNILK